MTDILELDRPAPAPPEPLERVSRFLHGKRIWVAGHSGMVGSALVRRLARESCRVLQCPHAEVDLTRQDETKRFVGRERPDLVVVAAARVGGILDNDRHPADFLYQNLMIASNVIEASRRAGVGRLLFLGSSCIYPRQAPQPLRESSLLTGPFEPTNEGYAVAKMAGLKLTEMYNRQHGCAFISAVPTNLYGPNDNYDLATSHVLPALIRKVHRAKVEGWPTVEVWGSGRPLREFLHADDLAEACLHLLAGYTGPEPVNIGSGEEVSIRELAGLVAETVGFAGEIRFDASKPDGMPRKVLDSSRIAALGWRPSIPLRQGLRATYELVRHGFPAERSGPAP